MDRLTEIQARCLWLDDDGICAKHSEPGYYEPCVEGPCPDMTMGADNEWLLDKIRQLKAQLE